MAQTLLTATNLTRESLRILHQKLNFIGSINREYDDRFSVNGAKAGETLQIRLPNQYTVRTGAALSAQETVEKKIDLVRSTQKGVDLNFSSRELTTSLDDFSKRILEPAMSVLAAQIEADALTMYKDVYNIVDNDAAAITLKNVGQSKKILTDNLAPQSDRTALWSTDHMVDLVDVAKGLFQDSSALQKQYREGMMGRFSGFDHYENTLVLDHTTGTAVKSTGYLTNAATAQTGSSLVVDTGTTTFLTGDIITIAGVNRVHPETKGDTGELQKFVITANSGASATSLSISPEIIATGAYQNVTNGAANNQAIVKVGAAASELLNTSMVYHKDAFAFVTADMEDVSQYGVWGARETFDGISMRIARQYDINNDQIPCRIDVLYGKKAIRPEWACRVHADG